MSIFGNVMLHPTHHPQSCFIQARLTPRPLSEQEFFWSESSSRYWVFRYLQKPLQSSLEYLQHLYKYYCKRLWDTRRAGGQISQYRNWVGIQDRPLISQPKSTAIGFVHTALASARVRRFQSPASRYYYPLTRAK